jgi:serine/threonine protein kinase
LGSYRLLQKVGEGGMREVWLAEQTRPVRRQVALKIIKAGQTPRWWSPASRPSARRWL